jgi:putative hemolysin
MSIWAECAIILLLIVLNGAFSLSELALVSARRTRLEVLARRGLKGARTAARLAEDPQLFLPTLQFGVTMIGILSGVFGGVRVAQHLQAWLESFPALAPYAESLAFLITVVVITFLTMVLGELVPKRWALNRPEIMAARVAGSVLVLSRIAGPLVWLLSSSSSLVLRLMGLRAVPRDVVTEEELRALLTEGAQAGVLELEERNMIERLLRLADKPVRAIMTPRTELHWLDRTGTIREISVTLRASQHSRFVVCDRSIDNVVGVVQAKDLLDRILGGGDLSVTAVMHQPVAMPDTVTALDALERLKDDKLGLALVLDEYGSFEGVVTAADVMSAIVGEAWVESPASSAPALPGAVPVPEDTVELDGKTPVDEMKSRLNLPELPYEGQYHTAGGLLLALLRRVPRAGDKIVFAGWRFEVLAMDGRRVDRLRIAREPLVAPPAA